MKKSIAILSMAVLGAMSARAQIILQEDFETAVAPALPATWVQTTAATTGWKVYSGSITANGSWVCPAHTKYAVIDDWNNNENNNPSILKSPLFSLVGQTGTYLSFDYYYVQAGYNSTGQRETAYLQISTNGGAAWTNIDTLKGKPSEWQQRYISLAAYDNMPNLMIAFRYADNGTAQLPGMAIDNFKVFKPNANDAAITSVTPVAGSAVAYGAASANLTLGGTIFNKGGTTITSYVVKYQQGANPAVTNTISAVSVAPFTSNTFSCSVPYTMPATLGDYPIKMWVELTGDADNTNDSGSTTVTAVSFMPPKKILLEEGTGTWCGWCPRGAVYMDSLWNNFQNGVCPIAVHNNDPMEVAAYDSYIGTKIGGYPSVLVDRDIEMDPSDLIDVYNERKNFFGFAEITMADQNAHSFDFSVKVSVKPAIDLSGDYRLALALTESDVKGQADGGTWDQHNYYSYATANIPLTGAGHNWQAETDPVPGTKMMYNFVARAILPSTGGASGSLPATMTAGTTYDYTFTTTIPQPYKRANMKAVAMLIRNSDGKVLNSNIMQVPVGISSVDAGVERLSVFPNPASDVAYVSFNLAESTKVNVQVLDAVGRVVYNADEKQYDKGAQRISVHTANLVNGLYTIKLQTEKGAVTQRLTVTQ